MSDHITLILISILLTGTGFIFVTDLLAKMILVMVGVSLMLALLFLLSIMGAAKLVAKLLDTENEHNRTMYSRSTGYPIE